MASRDGSEPVSGRGTAAIALTMADGSRVVCLNRIGLDVGSAAAGVTVGPLDGGGELVPAEGREAKLLLYRAMVAMRRQHYRNSPPNPAPKPASAKRRRNR
jgi:hypothetical protein